MTTADNEMTVRLRLGAPYEDMGTCETCNKSGPVWLAEDPHDWNQYPYCADCLVGSGEIDRLEQTTTPAPEAVPARAAVQRKRKPAVPIVPAKQYDEAALAWPTEPEPVRMSTDKALEEHVGPSPVSAWTFNAYRGEKGESGAVMQGCFSSVHHSIWRSDKTYSQTRGGPWYPTKAEATLAMRWELCRRFAKVLTNLQRHE